MECLFLTFTEKVLRLLALEESCTDSLWTFRPCIRQISTKHSICGRFLSISVFAWSAIEETPRQCGQQEKSCYGDNRSLAMATREVLLWRHEKSCYGDMRSLAMETWEVLLWRQEKSCYGDMRSLAMETREVLLWRHEKSCYGDMRSLAMLMSV